MKVILNLEKVRNVKVLGLEDFVLKRLSLYVNYYDKEPSFEHLYITTDLCESAKEDCKRIVEKAYNSIKQALFNNEKYVEIEL